MTTRPDLLKIVPGLAEARAAEEAARAFAFLDVTDSLLGVEVRPLSLRAYFELTEAGNLLMAGCAVPHAKICAFLWRASTRFCRPGTLAWIVSAGFRRRLSRRVEKMSPSAASAVIHGWIVRQRQDQPPRVVDDSNPAPDDPTGFHGLATMIDFFAAAYGWSEEATLDKPIARLWQLYRAHLHRLGVKVPLSPPSDQIKKDWVVKMIDAQASEKS